MNAKRQPIPVEQPSGVRTKISDLASWASTAKKSEPKPRCITKQQFDRAAAAVTEMIKTGDYSQVRPLHIYALFCTMHEAVYSVAMAENGAERSRACMQIGGFIKSQFGGDVDAVVDFVRWVWNCEIGKEQWRRANPGRSAGRLQVRWTFTASMVTDYRVDLARAHAK